MNFQERAEKNREERVEWQKTEVLAVCDECGNQDNVHKSRPRYITDWKCTNSCGALMRPATIAEVLEYEEKRKKRK